MLTKGSLAVLSAFVAGAHCQLQYGENQRGTIKDSDVVAQAFPDVEGIELLSPAFQRPETLPPGWSNGTDGPTDDAEMGEESSLVRVTSADTA
jgi:hypothetical protein